MRKRIITSVIQGTLSVMIAAVVSNAVIADSDTENKKMVVKSEIATGVNKILDHPIRDHGVILGIPLGTLGFSELGEYNPDGNEPFPLTSETDEDAILATFLDPNFVAAIGFDPNDIDPSFINVPLQKVKTLSESRGPDGLPIVGRETLPGILNTAPFQPSIAAPHNDVTLKQWMRAKGKGIFKCDDKGKGSVELKMKDLLPNRLYTVWAANVSAAIGPFNQPLGGAPSAVASDDEGNGYFKRKLNFCPLEVNAETNTQLAWVMVALHSDHMAYGGVFATNADSQFGGTVAHVHLHFPLLGEAVQ